MESYFKARVSFPPVNFVLEHPPRLLVVSPRDRIETIRSITLAPEITDSEVAGLENETDELEVSSLVVELGGLGATYPAIVNPESSLDFTIETVIEEWLHQYLAFRPLGSRYLAHLVGLTSDYEIVTMNETLAGMVSRELGTTVLNEHYPGYREAQNKQTGEESFDFNREMREIRLTVDKMLAGGEINQAEAFMEEKRQYLAEHGHPLRKLNQAYFAFYGSYAYQPASTSPIGQELSELRERYNSVKDFLNVVAGMNHRQDLKLALAGEGTEP
jgi:hypothetical protein